MKKLAVFASAISMAPFIVMAGGIDRSGQSIDVIFKDGRHLEFSLGSIDPDVSHSTV